MVQSSFLYACYQFAGRIRGRSCGKIAPRDSLPRPMDLNAILRVDLMRTLASPIVHSLTLIRIIELVGSSLATAEAPRRYCIHTYRVLHDLSPKNAKPTVFLKQEARSGYLSRTGLALVCLQVKGYLTDRPGAPRECRKGSAALH